MDCLRIALPDDGFGSRPELVAYITEVLEHNTVMRPEKDYITPQRLASNMLYSILHRLGIEQQVSTEAVRGPVVLNTVTGQWIPVAVEDLDEFMRDSEGFAARAQGRFRDEWNAEHPEAADA